MTKVYVTKYALTTGILECELVERAGAHESMVIVKWPGRPNNVAYFHREGDEWHATLVAAQTKVMKMIDSKMKSLEKQKAKLKKLVETGAKVKQVS